MDPTDIRRIALEAAQKLNMVTDATSLIAEARKIEAYLLCGAK